MNKPEAQSVAGNSMAKDNASLRPAPDVERLLTNPFDGSPLRWNAQDHVLQDAGGAHQFSLDAGIPCLFAPNEWSGRQKQRDVTELVKQFYETTPFPNYDDVDSRQSLKQKATVSVFARLVDEHLPHAATIFEAGCGTGQFTNFLGMGSGRTVVGGDVCMNSLKLAKGFRDRFSINNAHFVQINLFRPPFRPESFDFVISNGVLHHTSEPERGFRAIVEKLKPGGHVAIGLYNRLGRLPTLWQRALIERFGERATLFDRRLRGKKLVHGRWDAWFMDQYRHPHESRHSIDDVMRWFSASGIQFVNCVPSIGDTEFTDADEIFEPHAPGTYLDRLSTQLEMLLTGGADGGLFIMIGRKQ
jgi:SAM-dependent methyltransferase